MKAVTLYKHDGSEAGTVELPDDIFGIEPSKTVLYQAIKAYLANNRQGNASAKSRSEITASKAKPYRQKGTGRARAGKASSPLWVGGGVTFGPKPRSYHQKLNKKMRHIGLKSAYSMKAAQDAIYVVEDFELSEPKTKNVAHVLKALGIAGKKIIFLIPGKDENLVKSSKNIPNLIVDMAPRATTYHVANSDVLLMTRASIDQVVDFFNKEKVQEAQV